MKSREGRKESPNDSCTICGAKQFTENRQVVMKTNDNNQNKKKQRRRFEPINAFILLKTSRVRLRGV